MLNEDVNTYLSVRRAMGFKLQDDEWYLTSFAQFASSQGDSHVKAQSAITWASMANSEPQRANRLKAVIRFAHFSRAADNRHELPPQDVFNSSRQRPIPYIFSHEEIKSLIAHALRLGPTGSLRPYMYSTLIGLLAATGLRISEALKLRFQDITPDGLIIRETKFRKTRLVPLHPTTCDALEVYLEKRKHLATENDYVFVSLRLRPLSRTSVYPTFTQLLAAAGVPRNPGRSKPRLIDFRHTFATNALLACPNSRDHIGSHMLALTTYLGHAHVSDTYWYLESSPQLMGDIAQACEQFIKEKIQ